MVQEFHRPVLLKEVLDYLQVKKRETYIDATVGGGGASREILRRGGKVLGFDVDPAALEETQRRLKKEFDESGWKLILANFADLKTVVQKQGLKRVGGIIFDLGPSYYQLTSESRGFSFLKDSRLDMRMDPSLSVSASDLVNGLTEKELYVLFKSFGEEQLAKPISRALVTARRIKKITNTKELAQLIENVYRGYGRRSSIHPATRVFMALRMAVNSELENLRVGLGQSLDVLKKGGRILVISFHSLEDYIVKDFYKEKNLLGQLKILTPKPVRPQDLEIGENPSSRSAKLRVAQKT